MNFSPAEEEANHRFHPVDSSFSREEQSISRDLIHVCHSEHRYSMHHFWRDSQLRVDFDLKSNLQEGWVAGVCGLWTGDVLWLTSCQEEKHPTHEMRLPLHYVS